jgi:hypothetical protein
MCSWFWTSIASARRQGLYLEARTSLLSGSLNKDGSSLAEALREAVLSMNSSKPIFPLSFNNILIAGNVVPANSFLFALRLQCRH